MAAAGSKEGGELTSGIEDSGPFGRRFFFGQSTIAFWAINRAIDRVIALCKKGN
jgi:hypothetical protein